MHAFHRSWIGRSLAALLGTAMAATGVLPLVLVTAGPRTQASAPLTLTRPVPVAWTLDPGHLSQPPNPRGPWPTLGSMSGEAALGLADPVETERGKPQQNEGADTTGQDETVTTATAPVDRTGDPGHRTSSAVPAAPPARGWLSPVDRELLARTVYAEARGEPFAGQVAVAAVILNRQKDPYDRWPRQVAQIIYQPGAFSAVADGQIDLAPDATAYRAVDAALSGWDPTGGAVYYWNPAKTTNSWIWSRPVVTVIGQHWFAR